MHRLATVTFISTWYRCARARLAIVCARGCAPGESRPDEVLVHMRRFPQDGLLDHLAMTGSSRRTS